MQLERIRDLREDCNLTQQEMSKHLNISQRAYSYYESGERSVPLDILCKIADYHHTSVDYLLNRTNVKKPYS